MVECKVEWIPKSNEALAEFLDAIKPFIFESYTEAQTGRELEFDLALWLQLWDMKSGFFVVAREGGAVRGVAMCVRYRALWYARIRVDIDRIVAETPEIAKTVEDYIVGVADVLGAQEIYRTQYTATTETKERIYGSR
jgi:hypothetical protein